MSPVIPPSRLTAQRAVSAPAAPEGRIIHASARSRTAAMAMPAAKRRARCRRPTSCPYRAARPSAAARGRAKASAAHARLEEWAAAAAVTTAAPGRTARAASAETCSRIETTRAEVPKAPSLGSAMISSIRCPERPLPRPSKVSARPSSWRAPVTASPAAAPTAAAAKGGKPARAPIRADPPTAAPIPAPTTGNQGTAAGMRFGSCARFGIGMRVRKAVAAKKPFTA